MKILCVPDIHGRDFWIEPCKNNVDKVDKIVFLGDYHDPYPFQVSNDASRHMIRDELIPFVEKHKDKCICLFGNHDGNYLVGDVADRIDRYHREEIKGYLEKLNLRLIYREGKYLFSHSGVLPEWLKANSLTLEDLDTLPITDNSLLDVSYYRGGYGVGSCIWGDVREYAESEHIPEIYQVFGHTQLQEKPIILEDFACLDCRKTFIISVDEINEC